MCKNIIYKNGRSGGVAFRVIICAVSLILLGGAIFVLLKTFQTGKEDDHRRALQLSEYGLQEAFKRLAESQEWSTEFSDKPFDDDGNFTVSFTREVRNDTLHISIISTGVSGTVTRIVEHTLRICLVEAPADDSGTVEELMDGEPTDEAAEQQ
ncbi:MAG: hypothetical protein LBC70_06875 [Chitinispirillales bacterium]|jgi:hypothetical protein|nr:hypothetical protein [Chitinispirillales bacterium]